MKRERCESVSFTLAPRLVREEAFSSPSWCVQRARAPRSPPSPAQPSSSRSCPRSGRCVCVAAAPAAQGLVPTQLCLQSSFFRQEAAHLPLPPLQGSCELLSSFPLIAFRGSPLPGLLTLPTGRIPVPFVPSPFGAACSSLARLGPSPSPPQPPLQLPRWRPPGQHTGCFLSLNVAGFHCCRGCWGCSFAGGQQPQPRPQWLLLIHHSPFQTS